MKFDDAVNAKAIRPFDLILSRDGQFASKIIRAAQRHRLGDKGDKFSHVGIVVSSDILNSNHVKPGKLYIWESVVGGNLPGGDGVKDINGRSFFGVQLRNLETLVKSYGKKSGTDIAFIKCRENPLDKMELADIKTKFTNIYDRYNHRFYELNPVSCMSAIFPWARRFRPYAEKLLSTEDLYFCSELCFRVLQEFGVYDQKHDARNVLPIDFLKGVDEDGVPDQYDNPVYFSS